MYDAWKNYGKEPVAEEPAAETAPAAEDAGDADDDDEWKLFLK